MTAEESELHKARFRRIRRVKRWLRPLPRRATIHRYPVLRLFADAARKRAYLWSFRVENAVPAIYLGSILTFMPLYGVQIPLAFLLALLFRANLPILAGLQIVSNPITVFPIWFAAYQIGRYILSVVGIESMHLGHSEVRIMLDNFISGDWGNNLKSMLSVFGLTTLGGIVMGTFFGLIAAFIYRIVAIRTAASYALIRAKLHDHKPQASTPPPAKSDDNA